MKKRLLSLALALILVIGMIPVSTQAATTDTRRVKLMANTDYELELESVNGAPVYTKNIPVTLKDSTGAEFSGWAQELATVTDEATDEWNAKFHYNESTKKWTLVLKGAKLDAYNDETKKAVSSAYPIVGYGETSYYGNDMYITVTEDSYLEGNNMIRAYGTPSRWSSLTINGENGATLHGKATGYGIYTQRSIYLNVNLDCDTTGSTFAYLNNSDGTRYVRFSGDTVNIKAYQLANTSKHTLQLYGKSITLANATKFATYGNLTVKTGLCYQFTDLEGNPTAVENLPVDKGAKFVTYENHTVADCSVGGACTVCGATVEAKAAHEAGEDDSNCATPVTCKYCDEILVAAKEHTPKDAVIENDTEDSYDSVVYCAECNQVVSRVTVSKLCPHTNSTFLSQEDATCTEDGVAYYYCNDCEENYEVVLPATGHNHIAGTPVAPTIYAQGYTTYTCNKCGDSYDADYVDVMWAAASIGDQGYQNLKEAVEAAEDGDTILLRKNIKNGEAVYINKNLTINFNGHYYSIDKAYEGAAMVIAAGVEVTLWNGQPQLPSKLMVTYSNDQGICSMNFNYLIKNAGTLHVENLTLNGNNLFGEGDTYTVENSGVLNLNKGAVIQARVNTLNYLDGTVTKAAGAEAAAPAGYHFDAETGILEAHEYEKTLVEATVYEFAHELHTCECGDYYKIYTGDKKVKPYAKNETTGILYATLQEAVNEAEDGQILQMLEKVQNGNALVIPANKKLTIDMKGFYYAVKVAQNGAAIVIEDGAEVKLISSGANSMVKVEYVTYWMFDSVIKSNGTLTLENVTVNGNNLFNDGARAIVNNGTLNLRGDIAINIRQNDPRVDVFGGEGELIRKAIVNPEVSISASHSASQTVSPGKEVEYTITLANNSDAAGYALVTNKIPEAAEYVSGCDEVTDSLLTWDVPMEAHEIKTITYTLKAKEDEAYLGQALTSKAKVNGTAVPFHDIFVERTLGTVDQGLMETAIDAFRQYTDLKGMNLLKMIWNVAISKSVSYNDAEGNVMTAADLLKLVFTGEGSTSDSEGSGEEAATAAVDFAKAVIPTLFGGTGATAEQIGKFNGVQASVVTTDALMSGDAIFVQTSADDTTGKIYIYNGKRLFQIENGVIDVNTQQVLNNLPNAYRYAGFRFSFVIANRKDFSEDRKDTFTEEQKAVISIAEALLLRGDRAQYDAGSTMKPCGRSEYGEYTPEEYTSDSWKYTNCAMLTYDSYYHGLGLDTGGNWYTGTIINSAKNQKLYYYEPTGTETDAEKQAQIDKFYSTLQPADIIVIRRANDSGHAMLYIGDGKVIHSTGGSYKVASDTQPTGLEQYEATVRYLNAYDYFDPKCDNGGAYSYYVFGGAVTKIGIYRPLKTFSGSIPQETVNRMNNLQGIAVEKVASKAFGQTVNVGEELTYTFKLLNANDETKTVEITDVIPTGTSFVSANGATVENGNLAWTVTIPGGEKAEISYTVKVGSDVPDNKIESKSAKVGGVSVRSSDLFVANTLTASEQQAIIDAVASLSSSNLTNLELVNEIYKTALGVENVFSYTELKTLHSQMYEKKEGDTKYSFIDNALTAMVAPGLYGGRNFKCEDTGKYGRLTRLPREDNLIVGDILLGRTSSSNSVYIYLGNGLCWSLSSNKADTIDINARLERSFGYKNYWAILRPSLVIGE